MSNEKVSVLNASVSDLNQVITDSNMQITQNLDQFKTSITPGLDPVISLQFLCLEESLESMVRSKILSVL